MRDTGGPWKTSTPMGCSMWVDDRDDDTVPLLEGEAGHRVDPNFSIHWPGPWNAAEGNPFLDQEWKPLADCSILHLLDLWFLLH